MNYKTFIQATLETIARSILSITERFSGVNITFNWTLDDEIKLKEKEE